MYYRIKYIICQSIDDFQASLKHRATACSCFVAAFTRPFKITFKTDANEIVTAGGMANNNELSLFPGGIVGFQLNFNQISC
jgi:hypothetical protein